ncbi:hypothetical protein VD0004_g4825 [Verticillium dahliae]|uniref:Carboxylic ester hydrolase n=1 Tax=Verticillium dahliae TaxID=27337 RepID=A0A444S983_VERDA|nr:hypothetical protein VD0004_g4825 [Verticillium dahliae]PNH72885.1 hypothetical protein VD0001_g4667 [Verticillium dahliae]RXG49933.1 hypothetical protein VDGE_00627 [Verticillium dahliae]
MLFGSLTSLLAIGATLHLVGAAASPPKAKTVNGTYVGYDLPEFQQQVFLGIPYAKSPPLNNPEPLTESWKGTRSAQKYGNICPTQSDERIFKAVNATFSHDCLNLNIIRPANVRAGDKLPVAVWLHGGGFFAGFGAESNTNTSYVIRASVENKTPIITITLNYRLGFLGFPGGPQAVAAGITNLGLKDQRIALRWIQENIAAFGGDPAKVTLWGQSAGAISITHQILAYGGEDSGLFRGGIAVSGTAGYGTNSLFPLSTHLTDGYNHIANASGCAGPEVDDSLECLRKIDAFTLYQAGWDAVNAGQSKGEIALYWWPAIDGDFIKEPPVSQLDAGRFPRNINLMTGANSDEGLLSIHVHSAGLKTEEQLKDRLHFYFPTARPSTIQKILSAYPVDAPSSPYSLPMKGADGKDPFCEAMKVANLTCEPQTRRMASILGDFAFISRRRHSAESFAKYGVKTYSYRFDTDPTDIPISEVLAPGFATHASEYTYFFGFPPDYNMYERNSPVVNVSSHLRLSRGLVDKLVSYIATGDPNTKKVDFMPKWTPYNVDSPKNMLFNATASNNKINARLEEDTWRKEGMALWSEYAFELDPGSKWRR